MRSFLRLALVLLAGTAAAACDDDDGPTGPTRAQVAGIYAVCQLTFDPAGTLASVSLLDTAIETANAQVDPPELRVDATSTAIQLAYTPKGEFVERTVAGTYDLSGNRASLRFTDAASRNALLLPERLDVNFQAAPRQLGVTASTAYSVPRARYAELTGQSEANLAPQIQGQLVATFRSPSCG